MLLSHVNCVLNDSAGTSNSLHSAQRSTTADTEISQMLHFDYKSPLLLAPNKISVQIKVQ